MKRLALFASGSGTNLENLVRECHNGRIPAQAVLAVIDNPGVKAIDRAKNYGVPVAVVDRKAYPSKVEFEAEIIRHLEAKRIDYIVLAGFMRLLSSEFVARYKGRIINVHPSLLPAFPGAHGIQDAFEAGVSETGVTIHFVDEGVDTGPVILQEKIAVVPGENLASLEARIHEVEHRIYPEALRLLLTRKVKFPGA